MEYGNANPTNRNVQRNDALGIINAGNGNIRNPAQVWGSLLIEDDLKLFANFGRLFDNGLQWYGHTNRASRRVTGGFYFRNPHIRGGVFRSPVLDDGSVSLLVGNRDLVEYNRMHGTNDGYMGPGCPRHSRRRQRARRPRRRRRRPELLHPLRAPPRRVHPAVRRRLRRLLVRHRAARPRRQRLNWDASVNIGSSEIDQFIFDTVNASLGYNTPTSFRPGIYWQEDVDVNFDVSYPVNDIVNVAAGTEWRQQKFTIGASDPASWEIGPYAAQGFRSGTVQRLPRGHHGRGVGPQQRRLLRRPRVQRPRRAVDGRDRRAVRELQHFGSTTNGKISARTALTDAFSLRAAISTGFRAPTPGQQNAFDVTTAFIGGQTDQQRRGPLHVGPRGGAGRRAALARAVAQTTAGARCSSRGRSRSPPTSSASAFSDRIALSQEVSLTESEIEVLLAEGIPEARNFRASTSSRPTWPGARRSAPSSTTPTPPSRTSRAR